MGDVTTLIIVFVGILIFLAHLFVGIFSRTKIPDVLLLIIIGLCLGPFLGIVTSTYFGVVGRVFTTVTLIIILFEGGLELHLAILQKALQQALMIATCNFALAMVAVGIVTLLMTDLGPMEAFMLGAIVGSTSPAVIVPLVRQLTMRKESQTILFLESAVSDVLSIVVAIAILEAPGLGELRFGLIVGRIISSFIIASILGIISGILWSVLLNKVRTVQNAIFTTPAFVFIIFGITELLGCSGYVASLAFGVTLGNVELIHLSLLKRYTPREPIAFNETEKVFFSEIVFLLKTFFFVYVGLSIQLTDYWSVFFGVILTIVIFIVRIPVVRLLINKSTPIADASLMVVMVPKGLAAAVLASIPLQQGIADGKMIQDVTYAIVTFSILLTSILIFFVNKTKLSKVYGWIFSGFGAEPLVANRESATENSTTVNGKSE